jgi:hypothetical protein
LAQYGISITKSVLFRGVQQEFSNVYHYTGLTLNAADAATFALALKAAEVPLHSTDVTFLRYRVWTSGGSQAANQMVAQGTLSGTGNQATNGNMDRERAVLVRFAAGFDSRGHAVYLRKWYHSCGACAGIAFATGVLQNTAQIASADRTTIQNAVDDFLVFTAAGQTGNLCAESGRAGGSPVTCHPYLEHHQLGDMWR